MEFTYNGTNYDTYKADKVLNTTEDDGLKKALVYAYFEDEYADSALAENTLDVVYWYALMSARYQDLSIALGDVSHVENPPAVVVKQAQMAKEEEFEYREEDLREELTGTKMPSNSSEKYLKLKKDELMLAMLNRDGVKKWEGYPGVEAKFKDGLKDPYWIHALD